MNFGSLFSGIGGCDLGLERAGMVPKWQVEKNPFCRKVLDKHWPGVRKYSDIRDVCWGGVERVDLVAGGFPCQPFSVAGKRKGENDERNMWPEFKRCITIIRPTWVIGENVGGSLAYISSTVKPDMEAIGYRVRVFGLPASCVGARHQRKRLFIVGLLSNSMRSPMEECLQESVPRIENLQVEFRRMGEVVGIRTNPCQPFIPGVIDGVSAGLDKDRRHRVESIGNAVVPLIFQLLGNLITHI